jgi:hypothetical protein
VVEGHVVAGGQLVEVAVVADDGADVQRQQPAFPAEQQVVQAVAFLADQQDRPHRLAQGVQAQLHPERLGKQPQLHFQVLVGDLVAGELHPHEKQTGVRVVVLRGFFDIAAALQQEAGDGMNDARAVRAGKGENVSMTHGGNCRSMAWT